MSEKRVLGKGLNDLLKENDKPSIKGFTINGYNQGQIKVINEINDKKVNSYKNG